MTDNELLLAISNMMDNKLEHINQDIHEVKKDIKELKTEVNSMNTRMNNMELTQETQILPRLDTITSCYTDTFDRYKDYSDKMESAFDDIDLLKKVVSDRNLLISSAIFSYSKLCT